MPLHIRSSAMPTRRLIGAVVLWASLLFLLAFAVNAVGIYLAGGAIAWLQFLDEHRLYFFVWRLFLYATTAAGWLWARHRLLQRDPDSHLRVQFMERIALPLALVIELSQWVNLS